ncbi:MAG TPA: iron-containing alcohol dehydrogenase [Candidatus Hydrogenedentes bacterium]|nr:iron-containing alcohol dehydrogenase [Candidatus Hydrogenedentota bacterium]HPG65944.1 iron-containing alcohol dehydrogenase [Candidatus Hydrogenedentota bacterium]
MTEQSRRAYALLDEFKGGAYVRGIHCFGRLGALVAEMGRRASVVASGFGKPWGATLHEAIGCSLAAAEVSLCGDLVRGARPNAPREDVFRIADALRAQDAEVVVAVGGGSVIDAAKAAVAYNALRDIHPDLDAYFGVGQVSALLEASGRSMKPIVAAQLASGSAAHLTKYSNITSLTTAQKLLIVDGAMVPPRSIFDYAMTATASRDLTMDGALDGVAHCLEVLYGAAGASLDRVWRVSLTGIDLIVRHLKRACEAPDDLGAREALGLGTDLGGYAIMIGGTNGAHLTSFSLVDVLSHGRACAMMNPYYTVFFAPAIEDQLRAVGAIYGNAGYGRIDLRRLRGRDLGLAVAEAMLAHARDLGFPTMLSEVPGFSDAHIERALEAAKSAKLEMKLRNMPVPLSAERVDDYLGPVLEAARTGDFDLVRNMS